MILALAAIALADDAHLVYDLTIDGQKAGTRTVDIRFLPREDGERRVLNVYTELSVAGVAVRCRESASSSPRGANFSASTEIAGVISQVQGIEVPGGGWRLTRAEGDGVHESNLTSLQARLTTLDLLDPGRTALLQTPGAMGIIVAETGDLLAGTVADGAPVAVKIANQNVPATRFSVQGADGLARFDIDGNGVLLRSEIRTFGATIVATVHSVPPVRSYGTIQTIEAMGAGVSEEGL